MLPYKHIYIEREHKDETNGENRWKYTFPLLRAPVYSGFRSEDALGVGVDSSSG